tara:strand:+ start:90 stop:533 length:444 start_codon:yes stop_codon:yes gene_type:complete
MRKTKNKWTIDKCGRCGKKHEGYTGKLDKDGIEYVICGITHKRININSNNWRLTQITNEELLELIRKDRPDQVIHKVLDYRPHPLSRLCDVLYEVDVAMNWQHWASEITSLKIIKGLPYPVKPYADLQRKWEQETIDSWVNEMTKNE